MCQQLMLASAIPRLALPEPLSVGYLLRKTKRELAWSRGLREDQIEITVRYDNYYRELYMAHRHKRQQLAPNVYRLLKKDTQKRMMVEIVRRERIAETLRHTLATLSKEERIKRMEKAQIALALLPKKTRKAKYPALAHTCVYCSFVSAYSLEQDGYRYEGFNKIKLWACRCEKMCEKRIAKNEKKGTVETET